MGRYAVDGAIMADVDGTVCAQAPVASAEVMDRDGTVCAQAPITSTDVIGRDATECGTGIVQVVGGGGNPPTWEEITREVPRFVRSMP